MKKVKYILLSTLFTAALLSVMLTSCDDPQSPGVEFMPDMYRSPAIEPYVDYEFPDSATTVMPPDASIPRGYTPYPYPNTDEGLVEASHNLSYPYKLTEKKIKEGQALYLTFCKHCHGPKGEGNGTINNPIYGAVPSYKSDIPNRREGKAMKDLSPGHIYHTIMYGLNAMGPHASLIRPMDRWEIVAYVQTLQGNDPVKTQKEESKDKVVNDSLK